MRIAASSLVMLVSLPGVAEARTAYLPFNHPTRVIEGSGGTGVESHGITVWTRGTPPRRFRVVGEIHDSRTDKVFDGDALHSARIIRLARSKGGDALLLGARDDRLIGYLPGGQGGVFGTLSYSGQKRAPINEIHTRLYVIDYVDEQAAS